MYAVSNVNRVYISFLLLLCSAFLFAPQVSHAVEFINDQQLRNYIENDRFIREWEANRSASRAGGLPSNTSYVQQSVNTSSPSTNSIGVKSSGTLVRGDAQFPTEINKKVSKPIARNALKTAISGGRAGPWGVLIGGGIGLGLDLWLQENDYEIRDDGYIVEYEQYPVNKDLYPVPTPLPPIIFKRGAFLSTSYPSPSFDPDGRNKAYDRLLSAVPSGYIIVRIEDIPTSSPNTTYLDGYGCPSSYAGGRFQGADFHPSLSAGSKLWCYYDIGAEIPPRFKRETIPVPIDSADNYQPQDSDLPLLSDNIPSSEFTYDVNTQPVTVDGPTTYNYDSSGNLVGSETKTTIYTPTVINNDTISPSISIQEQATTVYRDANGNQTSSNTTTNVANPNPMPLQSQFPNTGVGGAVDFELPSFCSWASIVCDWIGWTKEGVEGEEPDLINLISEFEPDENEYNSGIGSGSCPAPMSLNLGIINRTVEVSYEPFCDFLDMIRPLVIAGAWLLSAFMYVGVLRRG